MKHVFARCSGRQHQGRCTALSRWRMMPTILAFAALFSATLAIGAAHAVPAVSFNLDTADSSSGIPSGTWGIVTLYQNSLNEVEIRVTPAQNVLFVNTGGPHTPFAFNLDVTLAPGSISMVNSPAFTPTYAVASATPFGDFSQGINLAGGNGASNGNPGPLVFKINQTNIGAITNGAFAHFVPNALGAYFAADLLVPPTGSVASMGPNGGTFTTASVPEPASILLLGFGLAGLGAARRLRHRSINSSPSA